MTREEYRRLMAEADRFQGDAAFAAALDDLVVAAVMADTTAHYGPFAAAAVLDHRHGSVWRVLWSARTAGEAARRLDRITEMLSSARWADDNPKREGKDPCAWGD